MVSKAIAGAGTQLSIGEALDNGVTLPAADDFVLVGECLTIGGPNVQKGEIDVTPLESLEMQFISNRPNPGALEITLNMVADDPGQMLIQQDAQLTDRKRNVRIVGPAATSPQTQVDFVAEAMTYGLNWEGGAQIQATVSFKISGPVTFT